jgi:predicted lactoylglutathione lyase
MRARISLITLGVDDLKRSLTFYRALGFTSDGIVGEDDAEGGVAFFKLENTRFALWERKSIAKDAGLPQGPASATEFMLAHNVGSKEEVDAIMPAAEAFWGGYTGYFQDPDGHIWEAAWNPAWEKEDAAA